MTSLINFKKAEHRNNKLFVYCFHYCLACSHFSKVNLLPLPEKKRGETKTGYKNLLLIRIKKAEIVRPKISLHARKTTIWKEFALLHQTELIQRKLTEGIVLGTRSIECL